MLKKFNEQFDDEDAAIWRDDDGWGIEPEVKTSTSKKDKTKRYYILQNITNGYYFGAYPSNEPLKARIFNSEKIARNAVLGGRAEAKARPETKTRESGKWRLIEVRIQFVGSQNIVF